MDVFEAIAKRKSVRKYKTTPIGKETIEKIISAGSQAPSGNNVQPVEYVVVTDEKTRKKIADICDYGRFIAFAPVCILVFSKETKYYLEDGCAAIENMLLAATALGLGTCWVAGDKKHYSRIFGNIFSVPNHYKLIALLAVGYGDDTLPRKKKRSLEEVLHWEKY